MTSDPEREARQARAEARRARMTVEVVRLGEPKRSPYADSSPEERLEAAMRLMEHHAEIRGRGAALPRSEWPEEAFKCGEGHKDLADVEELERK